MTSHIHLIVTAFDDELQNVIRDFKKFTSKKLIEAIKEHPESRREWLLRKFSFEAQKSGRAKNYKVWQDDNHAICLEKSEWILQRLNYIHQNPVRQMIVYNAEEYVFSSAIDYADGKGLVTITRV